jgi:hypothetical protein
MKFNRIKPTEGASSLLDPYNARMVHWHEANGFVCEARQADHLVAMNLAVIIESDVPGPGAEVEEAPAPRGGKVKRKVDEELV